MNATRCLLCHGGQPYASHVICPPGDMSTAIEIPVCQACHECLLMADWFGIMVRMLRVDASKSPYKGRDLTDALIADKYRLVVDVRARYLDRWKLIDQG